MKIELDNTITKKEIIICSECNGKGKIKYEEEIRYSGHDSDFIQKEKPCATCGGSGRRIQLTTITFKKFEEEK